MPKKILPKVFAAGDVIKPGRLTDATGDARLTAIAIDKFLRGEKISLPDKKKKSCRLIRSAKNISRNVIITTCPRRLTSICIA